MSDTYAAAVGGDSIPPLLAAALRRAHEAELTAVGERRRPAFRLTRSLLGGARAVGYPASLLAACLGVSVGSVRTRGSDGWIPAPAFAELAGLAINDIRGWARCGALTQTHTGVAGEELYLASELLRALTASTRRATGRTDRAAGDPLVNLTGA